MPRKRATKKADPDKDINKSLSLALSLNGMQGSLTIIDTVEGLLKDEASLNTIVEMCAEGSSVNTIEGALGMADGQLVRWLKMGRSDREGLYRILYLFFNKANSGARRMAETALLAKNPEAWLKRCDLGSVLDNTVSESVPGMVLPPPENKKVTKAKVTKEGNVFNTVNGLTYLDADNMPTSEEPESTTSEFDEDNG